MSGRLERLRELEAQATPAPWKQGDGGHFSDLGVWSLPWPAELVARLDTSELSESLTNAALIAEARNVLPLLLDIAEAAQAVKEHDDNDQRPLRPTIEAMYGALARLDGEDT